MLCDHFQKHCIYDTLCSEVLVFNCYDIKWLLILCITRVTDPAITLFLGDAVKSTSDYRHGIIQHLQDWVMLFEVTLDVTEGFFNGVVVWAIEEQEEYPCCIKNINHSLDMVYTTIVHDCN